MITVLTLLKTKPSPNGEKHGERPFWREFGQRYLDMWLANVKRFVPQPHQIAVMTDDERLLKIQIDRDGVEYWPIGFSVDAPGFWSKLHMFHYGIGKTLYCDLDNIIAAPIDALVALDPDPLIMLDDRRVPGLPNGSLVLFEAERCRGIWRTYAEHPRETEHAYAGPKGEDYWHAYDQAFIADWYREFSGREPELFQDLLPNGYILNARTELDTEAWKQARVIFGGGAEGKPHVSKHPGFHL